MPRLPAKHLNPSLPKNHLKIASASKKPLKSASIAVEINAAHITHTDLKDRLVKTFSGGQQARLLLASALIQDPDILLLDEPTNNLDKAGIEHLTEFLIDYEKTCLVISHDAEFLNAFTHGVLYLDVHTRKVEQYVGDYKDVVEQISARIEKENTSNARLEQADPGQEGSGRHIRHEGRPDAPGGQAHAREGRGARERDGRGPQGR